MWIAIVFVMFASVIGALSTAPQATLDSRLGEARATSLAANLVAYRSGVIAYANAHPEHVGMVTQPLYPTGYVPLDPPLWTNEVLADGTILVGASSAPPVDIDDKIGKLSHHSALAGRGRADPSSEPPAGIRGPYWQAHRE
ncbi:putative membrane channel-forming protein YqfA (hemolysin III family) [Actimicrobium sp. GrIS 1.19]|uniref:hypothetical protein n=1 Tax=Actimicrobium sp. GrIS 1.19 TaxID=3071708 RepID=UPI002DF91F91|nr:putative membrane channel-forming protein YqfA (hemolysin III family) [Actimicrobium sp. GrIS 1.19]